MSAVSLDTKACRTRTRLTLGVSLGIHTLLLLWLALSHHLAPELPALTEITFLESEEVSLSAPEPAPKAAPVVAKKVEQKPTVTAPQESDVRFRRAERPAEVIPEPQTMTAVQDLINARLAALQGKAVRETGPAATKTALLSSPARPAAAAGVAGAAPLDLNRGDLKGSDAKAPALELTRGQRTRSAPKLAVAHAPAEKAVTAAPVETGDANARRTLAGATLVGPIADRPVKSHTTPVYPEWAKREGVEGSVTLYFVVLPNGNVKENIVVQKTAGFSDFDENARAAILAWRFAPLPTGGTGEQWGTITFHFRLRDASG